MLLSPQAARTTKIRILFTGFSLGTGSGIFKISLTVSSIPQCHANHKPFLLKKITVSAPQINNSVLVLKDISQTNEGGMSCT